MRKFSKLLSILLCLSMLLSYMPTIALAAEENTKITFDNASKRTTLTADTQVWAENGITVTNNRSASSTNIADFSDPMRCYKNSDLIIAYPGMTKIVVDVVNESKGITGLTAALTDAGYSSTTNGNLVTITLPSPADTVTIAKLTNDVWINNITVYYKNDGTVPGVPGTDKKTVKVVIADYATANSWENEKQYGTITMDSNITVTASGGGYTGKYYNSGKNWRIYQTESPSVTVTAGNGAIIESVKITYAINNTGILTLNGENIASDTVVEVNAASITFGVGNTGTATNGQVRITAIEVIYHNNITYIDASAVKISVTQHTADYLCECGETIEDVAEDHVLSGSSCKYCDYVVPETLSEQISEAKTLANYDYLLYESTITGIIIDNPSVSNNNEGQYKFTVSDGTNSLQCYYVPVTGGIPAMGDTVKVTGKLTAYKGSAQFNSTASATITEKHTCDNDGATCTVPGACSKCSAAGTTIPHSATPVNEKPANCATNTDGNIAHYHCESCDKNFSDEACTNEITTDVTIVATHTDANNDYICDIEACKAALCAHDSLTPVAKQDANCTDDGINAHSKCDTCGDLFIVEGETKTPTTEEALKIPAKHGDDQNNDHLCDICNTVKISDCADSLDPKVEVPATTEAAGTEAHDVCIVCGKKYQNGVEVTDADLVIEKLPAQATIADGTYLIIIADKAMVAIPQDKGYGYPEDVAASEHKNDSIFTITNVEGGYTIQDIYGRYLFTKGTFTSFNVSTEVPSEGHIWSITGQNGNYKIVNVLTNKTLAYSTSHTSFGAYAELTDGQNPAVTLTSATKNENEQVTPPPAGGDEEEDPIVKPIFPNDIIDQISELTAGTYKMGGYLTAYGTGDSAQDWSATPYHMWTGEVATSNGKTDLVTVPTAQGNLASSTDAAVITLIAVSGKSNTYYIMVGDQYLCSTDAANRKLGLSSTPAEWVASDNAMGGITLSNNGVFLGTAGAGSKNLRSYTNENSLKMGVVFLAAEPVDDDTPVEPPVSSDPAADSELGIKDAADLGASKAHDTYTEGKYYVSGIIKMIVNAEYGNMIIVDKDGNELLIYGTYSADGKTRYDALDIKPVAGDTVKIYGVIGQYNGTPQMKSGWIVEHTAAAGEDTPDTPVVPDKPVEPEKPTTNATFEKVDPSKITEGIYLIWGLGASADDNGLKSGFMTGEYDNKTRMYAKGQTINGNKVTINDSIYAWEFIKTEGGFYIKNVSTGMYLYHNGSKSNVLYVTDDIASVAPAGVWKVTNAGEDSSVFTLQEISSGRYLSVNTFGSKGSKYLGFSAYATANDYVKCTLEFYKRTTGSVETPNDTDKEGSGSTKPNPNTKYYGTLLSQLKDGDKIVIYSVANQSVMTPYEHIYKGKYTKYELEELAASVNGEVLTYKFGAVVLTVHIDGETVSFTAPNGTYLYADGTDVKFVKEPGDNTKFVLEQAEGGFYIRCATANFNGKPQYLEVYGGYYTCYGMGSNTSIYTFQFYSADPETPAATGDYAISIVFALMLASAMGTAVLVSKKKEF